MGLYQSLYEDRYGRKPSINKYREKWAMQDVIDSVGYERAKELLVYYFKTGKVGHPIQFFFYNFDKIDRMERDIQQDRMYRDILRHETKKLVEGEE
jgi:hypothetical protein